MGGQFNSMTETIEWAVASNLPRYRIIFPRDRENRRNVSVVVSSLSNSLFVEESYKGNKSI